jgi:pyruvate formate lyase activating enzyme
MRALVGNISRYALHDGPGIRTTVFFKGCTLHCPWCHNPELISHEPEVAFYADRCISCGDCQAVCPEEAVQMQGENHRIDRTRCTGCGLCIKSCPAAALAMIGREYDLEELVEVLLRDRLFYEVSGGGVTLSGGEPTQQLGFIASLLDRLHSEGIHMTIETNGLFSCEEFVSACLDHLDLILFDLKFADSIQHQEVVGIGNEIIVENLSRLLKSRPQDVIVRIPIIPGYTATRENIGWIGECLRKLKVCRYSLLPYHPYGLSKAAAVGLISDSSLPEHPMEQSELGQWQEVLHGIERVAP